MSTDHQADSPDHSLSIDEAAARLGVSPVTIRRRIKTGEIGAFKRPTAYGFEWRILLDGEGIAVSTSAVQPLISPALKADHDQPSPEVMKLLDMLETERRSRDALEQRNEQLAGQVGFLQAKLQDAERQIALLSAPKDEAPQAQPEPAPAEPRKRPWWRQFFNR